MPTLHLSPETTASIEEMLEHLRAIERRTRWIANQQLKEEREIMTNQEVIAKFAQDVTDMHGEVAEVLTDVQAGTAVINGFPAALAAAIKAAQDANPAADLSALSSLSADLEDQKTTLATADQALKSAIASLSAPVTPPVVAEPPAAATAPSEPGTTPGLPIGAGGDTPPSVAPPSTNT